MSNKTPANSSEIDFSGLSDAQRTLASHEAVVQAGCDGYELVYCAYGHEIAWIRMQDLKAERATMYIIGGTVCMNICMQGYEAADKYPVGPARHLPVDDTIQDECVHVAHRHKLHQWPDWLCDLACQILENENLHSPSGKD